MILFNNDTEKINKTSLMHNLLVEENNFYINELSHKALMQRFESILLSRVLDVTNNHELSSETEDLVLNNYVHAITMQGKKALEGKFMKKNSIIGLKKINLKHKQYDFLKAIEGIKNYMHVIDNSIQHEGIKIEQFKLKIDILLASLVNEKDQDAINQIKNKIYRVVTEIKDVQSIVLHLTLEKNEQVKSLKMISAMTMRP